MGEFYQELANIVSKGEPAVLATVVSSNGSAPRKASAKMVVKKDGTVIGTVGGGNAEHRVRQAAAGVLQSGQPLMLHFDLSGKADPTAMICGGDMDIFLEPILPAEMLYLCGAGHISQSTAAIGKMLGFRVTVIDPRPEFNNADRFPTADAIMVEDYDSAFSKLEIGTDDYIVIQTPGHILDEQCLRCAVDTRAKYIGMIGSRKKVREVKERLLQKGVSAGQLERVCAPIGLEIGAETPEEISVSILAQIVGVKRGSVGKVTRAKGEGSA